MTYGSCYKKNFCIEQQDVSITSLILGGAIAIMALNSGVNLNRISKSNTIF